MLEVLWIARFDYTPGQAVRAHQHAFCQLICALNGCAALTLDDQPRALCAGQSILMPPGTQQGLTIGDAGLATLDVKFQVADAELAEALDPAPALFAGDAAEAQALALRQAIALHSPRRLVMTDPHDHKLALARRYGATHTYKRIAPPLTQPIPVKGGITGKLVPQDDGTRRFELTLQGGIGSRPQLMAGKAEASLLVVVVCRGDTISHAWAACGELNRVLHEIDPAGLVVEGNAVAGSMTLITHDDEYQDVHFERGVEEFRDAGEGPALAATYEVQLEADAAGTVAGRHTGTLGVAWERIGTVTGTLKPDAAP